MGRGSLKKHEWIMKITREIVRRILKLIANVVSGIADMLGGNGGSSRP